MDRFENLLRQFNAAKYLNSSLSYIEWGKKECRKRKEVLILYDPLCSSQDATYEKGIVVEVAPCRPRGKKGTVKISKSKMKNRSRKRKLSTWRLALKVRASVVCRGTPVLCVIADNNNNDSDHIEEAFYAGVVKLVEDGYAREKLYCRTLIWKNLILRKWFS